MRIGIVGATGIVGQELIKVLANSSINLTELRLSASPGSVGKRVTTHLGEQIIDEITDDFFTDLHFCFFCVSSDLSRKWVPVAAARGAVCIDNSSAFRMSRDVPIIVPEVNGDLLKSRPRVIANPNCCVAQLTVALHPIDKAFGIEAVVISTYQSVSGAGQKYLAQLEIEAQHYPNISDSQFLFNVIPYIGSSEEDGHYGEEVKIIHETRKILNHPGLPISVTAARVPVLRGHCESISMQISRDANVEEIRECLAQAPNIIVIDDTLTNNHPDPRIAQHTNNVYVGRIRRNTWYQEKSISMWVVADNLRKGAAHNALNIVETWCERL